MDREPTTLSVAESTSDEPPQTVVGLTIVFSTAEPDRMGEFAILDGTDRVLGREGDLGFFRSRPGTHEPTGPIRDAAVSRRQLRLRATSAKRVRVERVGRLPVRINGVVVEVHHLNLGDVIEVGDRLVLYLHRRARELSGSEAGHAFGHRDAHGLVGEGPAIWALRERVAFIGGRRPHALVTGESGTGKELVAKALHTLSDRRSGPWVARSAATIPDSLADAELFGNLRNYPNPGMPDRPGLIGEANGGTLFLDEFGQLPLESQSRLLRVLDDGEYSRLGESRSRRADLRLVAATNQPLDDLKHDVLARLPLRLTTPPLQDRREDIGLLITHLLRRIASDEPALSDRIFDGAAPHITARLVAALAAHPYRTHLRELSMLLWDALAAAPPGGPIDLPRGYADRLSAVTSFQTGTVAPSELSPEVIQAALDRHDGRQDPTWRELGLSSRYVLRRLVDKHGLRVRRRSSSGSSDDGG